jgi:hypothetical protein
MVLLDTSTGLSNMVNEHRKLINKQPRSYQGHACRGPNDGELGSGACMASFQATFRDRDSWILSQHLSPPPSENSTWVAPKLGFSSVLLKCPRHPKNSPSPSELACSEEEVINQEDRTPHVSLLL